MLYQPGEVFNVKKALEGGFLAFLVANALDFITGAFKPWTYYLGSILGYAMLGTGIPGASATLYVIGDTVDALLFKSPDGSDVRIFLNGIAHTTIDTYAAAGIWETLNINGLIGGQMNRIDIVNYGPSANPNATGVQWLDLGPNTVTGANAQAQGALEVALHDTLAIRLEDDEQDSPLATLPIYLPTGLSLANVQAYADAILPEIDAVTGSKITEATITFTLTLVGGLKAAPVASIKNERGGLISFTTAGPRHDSVRIPGILETVMPGASFDVEGAPVGTLVTRLLTSSTAANIRPLSSAGYNLTAALGGKKSLRRK
jgi:hypothetical protein